MQRINTYIPQVDYERLKALAEQRGVSWAEIFRAALRDYLDKEDRRQNR